MENSKATATYNSVMHYGLAMVIALIGLADSIYLTIQHLSGQSVRCTITSMCSKVLSSPYAVVAGFPTAAFGAAAYFAAFSFATLAVFGYRRAQDWLLMMVVPMLATTVWLLYVQAFVLRAYCEYCLLSAATTILLTIIAIIAKGKNAKHAK